MTIRVNITETVDVSPPGVVLAAVHEDELYLWPQGAGVGPLIVMSLPEWQRITEEVGRAIVRGQIIEGK